jgi:hypothetical protein
LLTVPPPLAPTFQRAVLQSGTMLAPKYIQDLQTNWTQLNLQFREGFKIAASLILAEKSCRKMRTGVALFALFL